MTGYLIGIVTFALAFVFGAIPFIRPRLVLAVGAVLAFGWTLALAAGTGENEAGEPAIPLWFVGGLVVLLYGIWCGGLWIGLRVRQTRSRA